MTLDDRFQLDRATRAEVEAAARAMAHEMDEATAGEDYRSPPRTTAEQFNLARILLDRFAASLPPANALVCRECGCWEHNCQGCIDRTGEPCFWIEEDLCSACATPEEIGAAMSGAASDEDS